MSTQNGEPDIGPTFEEFWELYDKKIERKKCHKAWQKLDPMTRQECILHVVNYVESTPDKRYRKNPFTYLFNESYYDEIIQTRKNRHRQAFEYIFERYSSWKYRD